MKKWLEKCPGYLRDKRLAALLLALAFFAVSFVTDGSGMTQEEKRVAQTLSQIDGAGRVRVTIYSMASSSAFSGGGQTLVGAVAVCEGAGDVAVRFRLTEALKTLLGLDATQVLVLEMEGKQR